MTVCLFFFFFQAEDGIRDLVRSRGLGDVYKRQEEDALALQRDALAGQCRLGALAWCSGDFGHLRRRDAEGCRGGFEPACRTFNAQRKRRRDAARAACFQRPCGIGQEGLRQDETGARADGRHVAAAARRQEGHARQAELRGRSRKKAFPHIRARDARQAIADLPEMRVTGLAKGGVADREWMAVDRDGRFVSQRELPRLALVRPAIEDGRLEAAACVRSAVMHSA